MLAKMEQARLASTAPWFHAPTPEVQEKHLGVFKFNLSTHIVHTVRAVHRGLKGVSFSSSFESFESSAALFLLIHGHLYSPNPGQGHYCFDT